MILGIAIVVCDGVPPCSVVMSVSPPSANLHTSLSCHSGPRIGALCHLVLGLWLVSRTHNNIMLYIHVKDTQEYNIIYTKQYSSSPRK